MPQHANELTDQLSPLPGDGKFQIIGNRYDAKHFGNQLTVIKSEKLIVRLVRDRGQIFADVASISSPSAWLDLRSVLVSLSEPMTSNGPWDSIPEVVEVVSARLSDLEKAMSE